MTVDELVAAFATIHDRASLIALLTPLRLPRGSRRSSSSAN
jgi:hypothetical protein